MSGRIKDRSGESVEGRRLRGGAAAVGWLAVLACAIVYGSRHLSPWAASWDEVDFALALGRFDLLAMQPHAPGYPYFILGGRLLRGLVSSPERALALWNLALTASSAWPIYALARRWLGAFGAALTAAIVLALPMNAALATGAMSEGAALALLWWYLYALAAAGTRRTTLRWTAAACAFGLLMGTRLSYAPFGLGLAMVWLAEAAGAPGGRGGSGPRRAGRLAAWALIAAAFQLLWLGGLAVAEGGFSSLLSLLEAFAAGHLTEWGGGVAAAPMPPGERLLRFVGDNVLWTGAFARTPALLALAALLLGLATALLGVPPEPAPGVPPRGDGPAAPPPAARRRPLREAARRLARRGPAALLAWPAGAYGAWALLGQNIAKPRHAAPLAALLAFALAAWALRAASRRPRGLARLAVVCAALALAAAETTAAARLVARQAERQPAVYQLADYLRTDVPANAVVYTWEEERVLRYAGVPQETRPILTYAIFRAEVRAAAPGTRILLTDSVLRGFREQAKLPAGSVRELATFRSDARLDPVYGTIDLYEWVRAPTP